MKRFSLLFLAIGMSLSANNTPAKLVTAQLTEKTKNKSQIREEKLAKRALQREEKTKLREERLKQLHKRLHDGSSKGVPDDACK